jgi:putative isomerase
MYCYANNKPMKIEKLILLSLFAALSYSCSNSENKTVELSKKEINIQNKYSNVINIKGEISSYRDINTTLFSDLGAWHAYALHYENDGNAGFSGPMLMDQGGKWISENFAKITIRNEGVKIDLSQANRKIDYYPGKLEVIYKAANIVLTQTLIFTDDRNSIIRNSIKNISDEKINLELYFEGEIMDGNNIEIKQTDDKGLSVQLDNKSRYFEQIFIPQPKTILIQDSMQSYIARFDKVNVEKGDVIDYYCKQKHDFEKSNFNDINFEKALIENKERWNQYRLQKIFCMTELFLLYLIKAFMDFGVGTVGNMQLPMRILLLK